VTVALLAVSAALSAQVPHVTAVRRIEEVSLARALEAAANQRRSADRGLHFEGHFLKGQRGKTYVPFTVRLDDVGERFRSVAVGVRVIGFMTRWADAFAVETEPHGDDRVFRGAFIINPGLCRVLIAVQDRDARGRSSNPVVLEEKVTVPDFSGHALQMSSVVVAERIADLPQGLSRNDWKAYPYAFGSSYVVPMPGGLFTKRENLTVAFQVYNVAMFEDGKPDVEVHFEVVREGGEREPIGKTAPLVFNQETVPDEFTLKGGYQLTPIQTLPLSQFEAGAYRLQIEVDDILGNKQVRAEVPFSVTPD
jgi:hypothetical protein